MDIEQFRELNPEVDAIFSQYKELVTEDRIKFLSLIYSDLKYLSKMQNKVVKVESIVKYISDETGVSVKDMISKKRFKEVVLARHIAMYLTCKHTSMTFKGIGRFFGGRDHSTVLHAKENVVNQMEVYRDMRKKVEEFDNYIKLDTFDFPQLENDLIKPTQSPNF
jgi:chromosomal replication initiator protein